MSRFKLFVGAACVAAVVLSTSVAFAKPLSEQQWRKQANVYCKQSNVDLSAIADRVFASLGQNGIPNAAQASAWAKEAGPSIAETIASIDALNEPKALKKDVTGFVAAAKKANAILKTDPVRATSAEEDVFAAVNRIGKKLGLVCGI